MFRHSLKLIYRNFLRFKSSFFINLVGLSAGLACALLIFLWVSDELAYDKFHEKDKRLFQVREHVNFSNKINTGTDTQGLLAEALANEMPEVAYATSLTPDVWIQDMTLSVDDHAIRASGQYAGKDFFNMFSFGLVQGNTDQVLSDKNSMVISQSLARKLFNTTDDVVGRTVRYQHDKVYTISWVFEDVPQNSSQQFDFVLSYERFKEENPWVLPWGSSSVETYVVLHEGVDVAAFNAKIERFLDSKQGDFSTFSLFVTPYSDQYLYGDYENGQQAGGRIAYVKLFSIIAVFILLIACINFMNLSTAKASRRTKEVGIKKALGASRQSLVLQYLGESVLITFLSLLVAFLLVIILLPQFNALTGKQLSLSPDGELILAAAGIALFTGLISGSYPALYLSGFNPLTILKGGMAGGKLNSSFGELLARKGLVVFQFTLSIILIVAVLVVYKQIAFVQAKKLGYTKDNIIYFEREGLVEEKQETFMAELRSIPGIVDASSTDHILVGHQGATPDLDWEGKGPDVKINFERVGVNYGMMELLDIEVAAGRFFAQGFGADTNALVFNEAAIAAMGITDPLGKVVKLWGRDMQIIGVAKDFHFQSLHEQVKPMLFRLAPERSWYIMAKIEAGREQEALAELQSFYQGFNPGFPFKYTFLDEDYQAQYEAEQRVSVLSRYFAGLAIFISCLGLYGLVAFSAEQRRKEIGIRKVLGASIANIMTLITKDLLKLVFIATLVGSALSWMAMSRWLEGFAYRISLGWWVFGIAGALSLLIALVTVSYQAFKAATANPVKNLRSE